MDGYKYIFDNSFESYNRNGGGILESFRDKDKNNNIYNFLINGDYRDEESLEMAKHIDKNLYEKFTQQKKSLIGYTGCENLYRQIDDLDSKHILILTFLFSKNINFKNIVEIGGGFGNMIRLINNIFEYDTWDIIDLPHIIELQKFYLTNEINDISKINFINCIAGEYNINKNIDIVIGIHSLSELSYQDFINYFEKVIKNSKYLYLGYNIACPSRELIQNKLAYINNNGFIAIYNMDYVEKLGAHVYYTIFENKNK